MQKSERVGAGLGVAPIVLHAAIAVGVAELTDTALWIVIAVILVARAYFGAVRILGRTIAWHVYEKERFIQCIAEEFELAQLPAPAKFEGHHGYLSRIAGSAELPEPTRHYAIQKLHYIRILDALSLIDRIREEKAIEAAMARYSAKLSQAPSR